jgi:hypothetical protein
MKKFYENATQQKGGEHKMRDTFSNTLLNSQFEKSLDKMSNQEFQDEQRMVEPIRFTLDNLSQRVVSLEQVNRDMEYAVKFWQEKANSKLNSGLFVEMFVSYYVSQSIRRKMTSFWSNWSVWRRHPVSVKFVRADRKVV